MFIRTRYRLADAIVGRRARHLRQRSDGGRSLRGRYQGDARQDRPVDVRERFFIRRAHQGRVAERKEMIDRGHDLPLVQQAANARGTESPSPNDSARHIGEPPDLHRKFLRHLLRIADCRFPVQHRRFWLSSRHPRNSPIQTPEAQGRLCPACVSSNFTDISSP